MPERRDQDPGGFYIHILDPGFPDAPWPGQRRLGPYPKAAEAVEQAADDIARGILAERNFVGIYSDAESEKMARPDDDGVHAEGKVAKTADVSARARELQKIETDQRESERAALEEILPAGIRADEVI